MQVNTISWLILVCINLQMPDIPSIFDEPLQTIPRSQEAYKRLKNENNKLWMLKIWINVESAQQVEQHLWGEKSIVMFQVEDLSIPEAQCVQGVACGSCIKKPWIQL